MNLLEWLNVRGGIAHRQEALRAGYTTHAIHALLAGEHARSVRRSWLVTASADPQHLIAAAVGGRVACVSAGGQRGWWIPPGVGTQTHVALAANQPDTSVLFKRHWSKPMVPAGRFALIESVEDTLRHVAQCLPHEEALVVWESACQIEGLSPSALRILPWALNSAQALACEVTGLADSGLETFFVTRMSTVGVVVKQQVIIAGKRVDGMIGDWLAIQLDGHEHHSTPGDRARDAAHDAELTLRGYTVLRFTYAQVIYHWPDVERAVLRAMAAGFHLTQRAA